MKQNQISDPAVFELFRIQNQVDILDTDQVVWNSCDLLQRAMGSFQPNLLQPEVLIKLSAESPLIRTRIEEIEIEEQSDSTALFAEIRNLDKRIRQTLANPDLVRRTIAIERRTGRLQAVLIGAGTFTREAAVKLLNKVCDEKNLKKRSLFFEVSVQGNSSIPATDDNPESVRRLLDSVKLYLEKQLSGESRFVEHRRFTETQVSAGDFDTPETSAESNLNLRSIALNNVYPIPEASTFADPLEKKQSSVVLPSRFKHKREGIKKIRSEKLAASSVDPETGEVNWLDTGRQMNWKQRKMMDRTIIDLAEQIGKLPKKQGTITREMTISFLACLTELQLQFMEDFVGSLTPGWGSEFQPQQNQGIEQSAILGQTDNPKVAQGDLSKTVVSVERESDHSESDLLKQTKVKEIESKQVDYGLASDLEEFKGISVEEMELHQKILETQKEFNVSYDRAASMVLK
ncbi:MAG: hypothetical protein MJE63_33535 [Proteobacteria bacterium]|nr:hypothetical protein [Pseudomonadota bacterium]